MWHSDIEKLKSENGDSKKSNDVSQNEEKYKSKKYKNVQKLRNFDFYCSSLLQGIHNSE